MFENFSAVMLVKKKRWTFTHYLVDFTSGRKLFLCRNQPNDEFILKQESRKKKNSPDKGRYRATMLPSETKKLAQ